MDDVFEKIKLSIADYDVECLEANIKSLDLSTIKVDYFDSMFTSLLIYAYEKEKTSKVEQKPSLILKLISLFSPYNVSEDYLPLITLLFFERKIPDDLLRYLAKQVHDVTGIEHLVILLHYEKSTENRYLYSDAPNRNILHRKLIPYAVERVLLIYRQYKLAELEKLSQACDNEAILKIIFNAMGQFRDKMGRPTWVVPLNISNKEVESILSKKRESLNLEKIMKNIITTMAGNNITIIPNHAQVLGVSQVGINQDLSRRLGAELCMAVLPDEIELFRLLGPVNRIMAASEEDNITYSSEEPDNVCRGGCRMFECVEFEYDCDEEEYGDNPVYEKGESHDWFTGSCDFCGCEISSRYWAVRFPILDGGWIGCFHSICCMKESKKEERQLMEDLWKKSDGDEKPDDDDVILRDKERELFKLEDEKIEKLASLLDIFKVYDR